ncbi:unnamed protein product [Mytilus edulis]|uniref:Uncharacterized protein n=1 Tax=Mytilus edulis TaxID=6550 RepID=A0A8S3PNV3_MYTED|nr:unnamed protein product [Mytilus edulis]
MNADKMYIPSMEKWSKYYQNVVQGNNKTYITHIKNTGRNGSFMIPIENQKSPSTSSKSNEKYNIHLVSPSAQMVEMAKESLEDEGVHELKMALLTSQNNFTEAIPSQLEVFEIPPYQLGVESISYEECRPTSQVTAYNPIEFNLCAQNGLEYIDLRRSKLYVKLRVKHSNGDNIAIDSKVAPVNGFF